MALGSWFSQIWRAAGPEIAAAAAIASGNPELAIPASQAAASTIKPKKQDAPAVTAPAVVTTPGFLAAYRSLPPADREVLTIGGAVIGTLILYRLVSRPRAAEGSAGHG